MRLQRVLQKSGVCSRRGAVDFIVEGRVEVDGKCIKEPGHPVNPQDQKITLDGKLLKFETPVLYAFHKPSGITCSMVQQGQSGYIAQHLESIPQRVVPIGRLDKDVSGLLLLTNDGQFSQKLAHPRYEVRRTYWAVCRGTQSNVKPARRKALAGLELEDGLGLAAHFEQLDADSDVQNHFSGIPEGCIPIEIGVAEGRHHFVKRLLGALDLPVVKLSRISFGPYSLKDLKIGQFRQENFTDFNNIDPTVDK